MEVCPGTAEVPGSWSFCASLESASMSSPEKLKLKGWVMFCIYKMHSCDVSVGIKK